jgi:hypothetical protein
MNMDMDDFGKRLGLELTSEQIQRIKTYREKAEESEVKYCEDHATDRLRKFYLCFSVIAAMACALPSSACL